MWSTRHNHDEASNGIFVFILHSLQTIVIFQWKGIYIDDEEEGLGT